MTQDVLYAPPTPADGSAKTAAGRLALKRAVATIGAAALGAYGLAAVFTYSPDDPSFNVATDAAPSNLLGAPGAIFADLAIQTFGAAAPFGLLALLAAGIMRVVQRRFAAPVPAARLGVGVVGIVFLAALAAFLPTPGAWPLATGFGGLAGDLVGGLLAGLIGLAGLPARDVFAALACAAAAAAALIWAFRIRRERLTALAAQTAAAGAALARRAAALTVRRSRPPAPQPAPAAPTHAPYDPYANPAPLTPRPEPVIVAAAPQQPVRRPAFRAEPPPHQPAPAPRPAAAPVQARAQPQPQPAAAARSARAIQPELPFALPREFRLPSVDLLSPPRPRAAHADGAALQATSRRLAAVLADFGVQGEIVAARPGPVVTLFELEPAPGVKSSRVIGLADDIARSMSATAARVAVIPGRNAIGIELPNPKRETVYLRTLLDSNAFVGNQGALPLALGESIEGEPFAADLSRMPHLLIAGTTGSGKSVGINAMILSLLYRLTPEECRFIMIDPKMLELSVYEGIPHLLSPVVTEPKKAVVALKWTVREMEERYRRMSKLGVRNIQGYNERVADAIASGERLERSVHAGFDPETGEPIYETRSLPLEPMPFIVVVIDEMADLMMVAGKEIEAAVQRLAQMARAAGIHLIMATQRPSVDVITGTIKANFPTRISYSVTSKIDSRTILGEQGAEQLLGMGDLLYMAGGGKILRLHGPFVHDDDVQKVVEWLKAQGAPTYRADVLEEPETGEDDGEDAAPYYGADEGGEDIYERAVQIVQRDRKASTSYLQRRLQVGYNRAASLIERMEKEGVVSAANHANKREVLLPKVNDD